MYVCATAMLYFYILHQYVTLTKMAFLWRSISNRNVSIVHYDPHVDSNLEGRTALMFVGWPVVYVCNGTVP